MTELEYLMKWHNRLQQERRELMDETEWDAKRQRVLEKELRRVNEQLMELQNLS